MSTTTNHPLDPAIIAAAGELEAHQLAVVSILMAHPILAPVKIVHEDEGDIENQIQRAFSERGLILIVLSPTGSSDSPDAARIHIDNLDVRVRIIEVPIINRAEGGTRIPINQAVQIVATHLHNKIIAGHALTFERFLPDPQASTPTKDCQFRTQLSLTQM